MFSHQSNIDRGDKPTLQSALPGFLIFLDYKGWALVEHVRLLYSALSQPRAPRYRERDERVQ